MPHKDPEAKKEYMRQWAEKNAEKKRAYQQEYYQKNKDSLAEYAHQWRVKNKGRKENRKPETKEARLAYVRQWRKDHPDRVRELNRRYQTENREKVYEQHRKWLAKNPDKKRAIYERDYAKNKDKILAKNRKWNATHPEERRKHAATARKSPAYKQWLEKNREALNAKVREWRKTQPTYKAWQAANKDRLNALHKKWRDGPGGKAYNAQNRAKHAAYMLQRYHQHRDFYVEWMKDFNSKSPRRAAIFIKWHLCDEVCYICGERVDKDKVHIDHVIPRTKGGTNDIQNLMPVHHRCNMRKFNHLDFPVKRPDLVEATAHVQAFPRKPPRKKDVA